jgi:outer membrane receptor for ferrienterochelin and colicin
MNKTSAEMTREELQEAYDLLAQQNAELTAKVNWLMEQFRLSQHNKFGSSSERVADGQEQLSLFNEAEVEAKPDLLEPTQARPGRESRMGHSAAERLYQVFQSYHVEIRCSVRFAA